MNVSNKKWLLASLLFFVIVYGLSFAVQHPANNDHEIILTDVGFDTPVLLHAQCTEEEFDRYTEIVKEIYQTNHKRFDIYHEYPDINNLYTINQQTGTQPVSIDSTTLSGIELAIRMNRETGAYDPSIGSLLSLWHQYREQGQSDEKKAQLPPDQDIREALQHAGCDKIMINGDQISFTDPQLQLDLGGIAKGYVTQLAKEALEKAGCRHGFINAGGNVVLIGNKEDGSP
ncbi:MAG: FAD:protein FMN transferase, partial [Erysipelotrichaceae bacterium]|nr:FAD:protein FMN transferase [Erysipelotrichaceae bacterium]